MRRLGAAGLLCAAACAGGSTQPTEPGDACAADHVQVARLGRAVEGRLPDTDSEGAPCGQAGAELVLVVDIPAPGRLVAVIASPDGARIGAWGTVCSPAAAACAATIDPHVDPGPLLITLGGPRAARFTVVTQFTPDHGFVACDTAEPIPLPVGERTFTADWTGATNQHANPCAEDAEERVVALVLDDVADLQVPRSSDLSFYLRGQSCEDGVDIACARTYDDLTARSVGPGVYYLFAEAPHGVTPVGVRSFTVRRSPPTAPLTNGTCAQAQAITLTSGTAEVEVNLVGARPQGGGAPCSGLAGAFYAFTLDAPHAVHLWSTQSRSLALLQGDCTTGLACELDAGGSTTQVMAPGTYVVRVGMGWAESSRPRLTLNLADVAAPPGDVCSSAPVMPFTNGEVDFAQTTLLGARDDVDFGAACPGALTGGPDGFVSVTLGETSDIGVAAFTDTLRVVIFGGNCDAPAVLACGHAGQPSVVARSVPPGTVWIGLEAESFTVFSLTPMPLGTVSLRLLVEPTRPVPTHDSCAGAMPVELPVVGSLRTLPGTTRGAFNDEGAGCDVEPLAGPDVVYSLHLGERGAVRVTALTAFQGMRLNLTGAECGAASFFCTDGRWDTDSFAVPAGTYHLVVDGWAPDYLGPSSGGDFVLDVELMPPP